MVGTGGNGILLVLAVVQEGVSPSLVTTPACSPEPRRQQKGRKALPQRIKRICRAFSYKTWKASSDTLETRVASKISRWLPPQGKQLGLSQSLGVLGNRLVNLRKGKARVGIDSDLSQSGCESAAVISSHPIGRRRADQEVRG